MNLLGFISQFIPELISFLIAWGDQCYAFCFIRSPGIFLHLIVHWYRFIPLYGEIHFKRQVSCPRTQHNGTVRSLTWSALPCKEVCRVTVITVLGSDSLEPVRRVETPRRIPHIHVYLVFPPPNKFLISHYPWHSVLKSFQRKLCRKTSEKEVNLSFICFTEVTQYLLRFLTALSPWKITLLFCPNAKQEYNSYLKYSM